MRFLSISLLFALAIQIKAQSDPIITLPNGQIRGKQITSYSGAVAYEFRQIPYATPPVGSLRYKEPQPVNNWDGILDTTSNTKICNQYGSSNPNDERQSEDCLYLNVRTPAAIGENANLPVYFWIHGGAFLNGDGTGWGASFWLDQGIVVVTINYRLAQFGFLTTEDDVIPANLGLKDQIQALKWVNQNIALFGGDPNKVTIGGGSAGAASVGYLLLSPLTRGLFRAAIQQSGSSLCAWSYNRNSRKVAYDFAKAVNPSITDSSSSAEVLQVLQNADEITLRNTKINFDWLQADVPYGWAPVVESSSSSGAVFTGKQDDLFQNGNFNQVPILLGINSEEEVANAASLSDFTYRMQMYDNDLSLIIHAGLNVNQSDLIPMGQSLRSAYTNTQLFQNALGDGIRYYSDTRFTIGTIRHASLQSRYTDVYFYQFSYIGEIGGATQYNVPGIAGSVAHGGETMYFWSYDNEDLNWYPEADALTLRRTVTMWANFIKTLNPTPESDPLLGGITWPKFTESNAQYLDIDTSLTIKSNPREYQSWKILTDRYANPPFDVY